MKPLYVGDLLPALALTVTVDGVVVDFTAASSVVLTARLDDTLLFANRAATTATALGVVTMAWQAADTDTAGLVTVEIIATFSGKPQTFRPEQQIRILPRLATV